MQFTGKSLDLVREALDLAIAEIDNEIGTCPDVAQYAAALLEAEAQKAEIEKLIVRIDTHLSKKEQP